MKIFDFNQRCQDQIRQQLLGASTRTGENRVVAASGSATPDRARPSRIRQSHKPLMNKLEAEWFSIIKDRYPNYPPVRPQAKRYKIAGSAWYKPDLTCSLWPDNYGDQTGCQAKETAFECKGGKNMKGRQSGILALKTAAYQWPEVRFVLVWKQDGKFQTQVVVP